MTKRTHDKIAAGLNEALAVAQGEDIGPILDARNEIARLERALAYLAECCAATAEGLPSRASKSAMRRHASICERAAAFLAGSDTPRKTHNIPVAIARCEEAARRLKERSL